MSKNDEMLKQYENVAKEIFNKSNKINGEKKVIKIDESKRKAYKEVYLILNNSTKEIKSKIPKKFMELLQNVISNEYEPSIEFSKSLLEQNLMPETITILAIIYKNFLCDDNKKRELTELEQTKLLQIELEKREIYKFDWDKINNEKAEHENSKVEDTKEAEQQQKVNPENTNTQLVEYKEDKWYKKVFSFIKKVFKR